MNKCLSLLIISFSLPLFCASQSPGDYRSKIPGGNWGEASTWETYVGADWVDAIVSPTSTNGAIEIQNNSTVTVATTVTIDEVKVTGTLITTSSITLENGTGNDLIVNGLVINRSSSSWTMQSGARMNVTGSGVYVHNTSTGVTSIIAGSILDAGSTWVYRRTTVNPSTSFSNRTYENLKFEDESGSYTTVLGSGSGTLTVNGDLTIDNNVSLGMGTWTGTLVFNGNILINGEFTPDGFSVANGKTLTVNGTFECEDQVFSGAGNFTLSPGAKITTAHANGLNSSGSSGSIQVTGTRIFSSTANYEFYGITGGTSTATGIFTTLPTANTVNNLRVSNAFGNVTLSQTLTVSNDFTLNAGKFILGANNLTVNNFTNPTSWGASSNDYIVAEGSGSLNLPVSSATIFPTGTIQFYLPCRITGSGNISVNISDLQSGTNDPTLALTKQWNITGTSSINVDFQWPVGAEGSNFSTHRSNLFLYKNNGSWSSVAGPSAATGSGPYTISFAGISCCSGFVPGAEGLLPIDLLYFKGKPSIEFGNELTWATASETNNNYFSIEKKVNGQSDFSVLND